MSDPRISKLRVQDHAETALMETIQQALSQVFPDSSFAFIVATPDEEGTGHDVQSFIVGDNRLMAELFTIAARTLLENEG